VHQVLQNPATYDKGGPTFEGFRQAAGNGLASCPQRAHRRQRRLVQPAFRKALLPAYATLGCAETDAMLQSWRDGQTLDLGAQMHRLAARSTARTLFSTELDPAQLALCARAIETIAAGVVVRMLVPTGWSWLPIPVLRRFHRALDTLDALTHQIVRQRRTQPTERNDLLSMLLAPGAEHGDPLDDQEIHDQVVTLILAGTETTATLLTWALHMLMQHPPIQERLQAETDRVLAGGIAEPADAEHLPFTTAVLTETMRMWPAGWVFTRAVTRDTDLAGHRLPVGTTVAYSPYLLGRRTDLYSEPDQFIPDRWLNDGHAASLPPGAFVPFGGGTRKCVGDNLALLQAPLTLASIIGRWQLTPDPGSPQAPAPHSPGNAATTRAPCTRTRSEMGRHGPDRSASLKR
jgi:pentalenene oxygenase